MNATIEATSRLSRSIMWELRHPINMGGIFEGRELSRALRSHATSFTNITSVPAEFLQTGTEPVSGLPMATRSAVTAFTNMSREAERLGGRLIVEARGTVGGATITCVIPLARG